MTTDASMYTLISIGSAAENKLRGTPDLRVSLTELHPMISGELTSDITSDTVEGIDSKKNQWSAQVFLSNTVLAKWRGDGSNRISSPDIRRGERLDIWQFGKTDQYFWSVHDPQTETSVRKRETVTHVFSNTVDEEDNKPSAENSWVQEVSTHDKVATLIKTTKSDGEQWEYLVQVDAKSGTVVIADDLDNYIQVNSGESTIEVETSMGARVFLNKKDIEMFCENYTLNVSGERKVIVGGGETIEIGADSSTTIGGSHTVQGGSDGSFTYGGQYNLKAAGGTITLPKTTWKGGISFSGGDYDFSGSSKFAGDVTAMGGSFTHNGVNVGSTHFHIGNQGKPTSPPQ